MSAVLVGLVIAIAALSILSPAAAGGSPRTQDGNPVTTLDSGGSLDDALRNTVQLTAGRTDTGASTPLEACSGMLLDGGYVLTARHCLRDDSNRRWDFVKIAVGVYQDGKTIHYSRGQGCQVGSDQFRFLPGTDQASDYGLVSVRSCLDHRSKAARSQTLADGASLDTDSAVGVGTATVTLGHPGDKRTKDPLVRQLWRLDRSVSEAGGWPGSDAEYVETAGAVAPGMSGSPLMVAHGRSWQVAGVLVSNRDEVAVSWPGTTRVAASYGRYVRLTQGVRAQLGSWRSDLRSNAT